MSLAQSALAPRPSALPTGIAAGTEVLTLRGARRIETLAPGDRIVTRSGAIALRGLTPMPSGGFLMRFDRREVVLLAEGQVYGDTGLSYTT